MTDIAHAPEDVVDRRPHPEGGEHGSHPSDKEYILIALILSVLTGIEVAISYIKSLGDAAAPLLLMLAATKFAMVAAFFMHLRFDNRVLRRLFLTGIILAIIVYIIVLLMFGVFAR
jgi:cytochrome c oxidase subunit 4